jgi:hypothetical protein
LGNVVKALLDDCEDLELDESRPLESGPSGSQACHDTGSTTERVERVGQGVYHVTLEREIRT